MKKTDNRLVLEGEAAVSILKASRDLGYPAGRILIAAINHGLRPALKAMGQQAVEYDPEASQPATPVEIAAPKVVNSVAPAVRKPRGRPRVIGVTASVFNVPSPKVAKGKRGRPRSVTPTYQTDSIGGDDNLRRRGRPPGSKNKPKSESIAVVSNGNDVTEV